jgi:hypothetical protein
MTWITDWDLIEDSRKYVVAAIAERQDKRGFYLYEPKFAQGWQVKQLLKRCYAALPVPTFKMPEGMTLPCSPKSETQPSSKSRAPTSSTAASADIATIPAAGNCGAPTPKSASLFEG